MQTLANTEHHIDIHCQTPGSKKQIAAGRQEPKMHRLYTLKLLPVNSDEVSPCSIQKLFKKYINLKLFSKVCSFFKYTEIYIVLICKIHKIRPPMIFTKTMLVMV